MPYKTLTQLQEDDFIKPGDNWILSDVVNKSHNALADNFDILKDRLEKLATKSGINAEQKKTDTSPIYPGTTFVKSGMALRDSIGVLDEEIYNLEIQYTNILATIAGIRSLEWILRRADLPVNIIQNTNTSYTTPAPLQIADLSSFVWMLLEKDSTPIFTGNGFNNIGWPTYSKDVQDILKTVYALEKETASIIVPATEDTVGLFACYEDEATPTEGGIDFKHYLKYTPGKIFYGSNLISFDSESAKYPAASFVYDYHRNINKVRFMSFVKLGTDTILYLFPSAGRASTYGSERSDRLVRVQDVILYVYSENDFSNRVPVENTFFIENVDYFSYLEIKSFNNGKFGMVLANEFGDILFRSSVDGVRWYEDNYFESPADAIPPVIVDHTLALPEYKFDYPTVLTTDIGGAICFYNTHYDYGVLDDIHYAFFRPGDASWTIPGNFLDINGIFPKLIKRRNGEYYICYHSSRGIEALKLFFSFSRIYTAGSGL